MIKEEDKRVIKTKKAIREAFLSLIEQRGYNNVSVSNICQEACINRNTFYLHYENKDDLLKQITNEVASRITQQISDDMAIYPINKENHSKYAVMLAMRKLMKLINEELELIRIIVLDRTVSGYAESVKYNIKKDLARQLQIKNYKSNPIFEYAFDGMYGVIIQFIVYYPQSENQTVKLLTELIYDAMIHIWG